MLQPPVDVLRAAEVARGHHRWQTDKAGKPYFDAHVADVHRRLVEESTAVQAVALLHDVLDALARQVKLADIASNTDPARLAELDEPTRDRLTEKYRTALAALC